MGKNSHLHFSMETSLKELLKEEAARNGMYMAEYCRAKIREGPRLERIEKLLLKILESLK